MLQIDQRGAKANCSGTSDNLLISDMILRDARYNRKNMSCAWLDVKKAYDSVSHKWLKNAGLAQTTKKYYPTLREYYR